MALSGSSFGFALILLFFRAQMAITKNVRYPGYLDMMKMPQNCRGEDVYFCFDKHPDYPQKNIDTLLTHKFQLFLGNREQPVMRQGSDENVCETISNFDLIYEIIDEYDNVRVVVQSPTLFKQQLQLEQCKNPGLLTTPTTLLSPEVLKVNNLTCTQKRMDYSFLVLTKDGEGLEAVMSKWKMPVACVCRHLQQDETN